MGMTSSKLHQLGVEGNLNRMKNERHKKMTRRASVTTTKPRSGRPKEPNSVGERTGLNVTPDSCRAGRV
jgi:hypothetical protein